MKQGFSTIAAAIFGITVLLSSGCGSSGGRDVPPRPLSVISFTSFLVDIGERFEMDASLSEDPDDGELEYFWSKIHPNSDSVFENHCEDEPETACFTNDDDICLNDDGAGGTVQCDSNDDCTNGGDDRCLHNSGSTSPECTEGICLLENRREREFASFIADRPGPYTIRLLVETTRGGTDIGQKVLGTFPQLLVVGSLYGFGGARGALVAEYTDARSFAARAIAGVSSPFTGNLLLAVETPGVVREFDRYDGSIIDTFGETASVGISPIDIVFGQDQDLYAVDADGTLTLFDGVTGLFLTTVGDVTTGAEQVSSVAIRASNGNLLVADGRAGQPIREHDITDGSLVGVLGVTGGVVQAVALAVADDGTMYIADQAGDVVVCDEDGAVCSQLGGAADVLVGGGPTAIALNPAGDQTVAQVVVADAVAEQVVGCMTDGSGCTILSDTVGLSSSYADIFFAPAELPTTTTTTTTSTTMTTTTTTLAP